MGVAAERMRKHADKAVVTAVTDSLLNRQIYVRNEIPYRGVRIFDSANSNFEKGEKFDSDSIRANCSSSEFVHE
jgi:hypothetical protein